MTPDRRGVISDKRPRIPTLANPTMWALLSALIPTQTSPKIGEGEKSKWPCSRRIYRSPQPPFCECENLGDIEFMGSQWEDNLPQPRRYHFVFAQLPDRPPQRVKYDSSSYIWSICHEIFSIPLFSAHGGRDTKLMNKIPDKILLP